MSPSPGGAHEASAWLAGGGEGGASGQARSLSCPTAGPTTLTAKVTWACGPHSPGTPRTSPSLSRLGPSCGGLR